MHSPGKCVVSVVCLIAVAVGAPVALAQAIPKTLIRLCLRNIATGIACYIVGRGGELIVDGSLSSAWAKAKEAVTDDPHKDESKANKANAERRKKLEQQLNALTSPLPPSLNNSVVEPLKPSELGVLSKRLPGSPSKKTLSEGFLIYDLSKYKALKTAPDPLGRPPLSGKARRDSLLPKTRLGERARSKSMLSEPGLPKFEPPDYGGNQLNITADDVRPPNTGKRALPTVSLKDGRRSIFGASQLACQKRRERKTGLSFLAIVGTPDFEAKLKRRMEEVVKPCMSSR